MSDAGHNVTGEKLWPTTLRVHKMAGLVLEPPECWVTKFSGLWSAGSHGLLRQYHVCRQKRGHPGRHQCGFGRCAEIWRNERRRAVKRKMRRLVKA